MIHLIKEIKKVVPFSLTLRFNTEEILQIDLKNKLKEWSQSPDSKFKTLLDPTYFQNVKLDNEAETIYWDNGIDLCPDVLYSMGKEKTPSESLFQKSTEETPTIA